MATARTAFLILPIALWGFAGCSDTGIPTEPYVPADPNAAVAVDSFQSTLVHWWRAEGDAADSAGTAHGRVVGDVALDTGRVGQAFSFDSSFAYVDFGTAGSLDGAPRFTISAWVHTDTAFGQVIVQRDRFGFNGEYMVGIGQNHDKRVTRPGAVYFMIYNEGFQWEIFSSRRIDDGEWHHVAVVRDSTVGEIWIDGELDMSLEGPYKPLSGALRTYIGADVRGQYYSDDGKPFRGRLDEVRIFTTALGATEIGELSTIPDTTPPAIHAQVTGDAGDDGWFVSDVAVAWSVSDAESEISATSGCDTVAVTSDTPGQGFTCTATSAGGTADATAMIRRDATPPVVSYAGNLESYTVDQAVAITCTASDATSGLATNGCTEIAGDAYTFDVGVNSFAAAATDVAGNVGSAATSFEVVVTHDSLCVLTRRFVDKAGVANGLCSKLDSAARAAERGDQVAARDAMDSYIHRVRTQVGKAVSADHAAILIRLAEALIAG